MSRVFFPKDTVFFSDRLLLARINNIVQKRGLTRRSDWLGCPSYFVLLEEHTTAETGSATVGFSGGEQVRPLYSLFENCQHAPKQLLFPSYFVTDRRIRVCYCKQDATMPGGLENT